MKKSLRIIVLAGLWFGAPALKASDLDPKLSTGTSTHKTELTPHHDGRHYFISHSAPTGQPTQADIDAAISDATGQGRIIKVITGGLNIPAAMKEVTSLPVIFRTVINDYSYDITVISMNFTPTGATLNIGCRFTVPNTPTNLYFGANGVPVSGKSGFKGDLPILESSLSEANTAQLDDPSNLLVGQTKFTEFVLPGFKDHLFMGLGKASKMDLSCGAFGNFTLSGYVKAGQLVEKEGADGQYTADGKPLLLVFDNQQTADWKDIFFDAKVSSGFHAAGYDDLGFHFGADNPAKIDLSNLRNPDNLPSCAQVSAENWQGVAFPTFKVRLPGFFKLRSGTSLAMGSVAPATGKNLFMDANGLIGNVAAENVYTLQQGYTDEVNKYDMSLDNLTATYTCNGQVTVSMLGKIGLPWCGAAAKSTTPQLDYSFRYSNNRYEVFIKDTGAGTFSSNKYALSTGSDIIFNVNDNGLSVKASLAEKPLLSVDVYGNSICKDFPAKLSASQCTGKQLLWSTGDTGSTLTIKPLVTTTYSVKCQDNYCVAAVSDSIKITVYESLPSPTLVSGRDAFCRPEGTDLRADNCVGKMEWQLPGSSSFKEYGTDQRFQNASFPDINQTSAFTYSTRCNLNGCLSPVAVKSVTVNPEPAVPDLYSNAANNTIDRNGLVSLGGSCDGGARLIWENLAQSTLSLSNTSTYNAVCRNDATGCQSRTSSSITISVLYFPPGAPSNLTFPGAGTNYLTLTWQDNSNNEDGFQIFRSTSPSFVNPQIAGSVAANTTSFQDNNLLEGVTYYYQVIAHNKYDHGYSGWAGKSTLLKPTAPELSAVSSRIVRGTNANVNGSCKTGSLVWTVPVGYGGGERNQTEEVTYWAKCVSNGVDGPGSSITVYVYDAKPGVPVLSAVNTRIPMGGKANVTGVCPSGTALVWTVPVGFGGGLLKQEVNTTYWAKCVGSGGESDGASIAVNVYNPCEGFASPAISGTNNTVKGENFTLTASGCADGSSYSWEPQGNVRFDNGVSSNEISIQSDTNFKVSCRRDNCYSESSRYVSASDRTNPCEGFASPAISGTNNTVKGENFTLTASGCADGSSYSWEPQGNVRFYNGVSSNEISIQSDTNFKVSCRRDNCYSESSRYVSASDRTNPCDGFASPAISGTNNTVKGENFTLTASGCADGSSYSWEPQGNVRFDNGVSSNEISIQSDTNFKVSCRRDNCYSESSRYVSASDRTNPCEGFASPAISGTNNTVKGENFTLTASGCADGSSYSWEPQGNVRFYNGVSSNEISIQSDTNFKVSCRRDNCYSESSRYVSASDRTNPCDGFASPAISGTNNTVKGENFTLTASGCADGSSYSWEPQGNVRFDNGVSSNEISIQSDTNFKVSCRRDNCYSESSRYVSASDRTNPCDGFASPAISGTNNTVKGENFTLTASGCADGSSYSWEPQGNVRFDNGVSSNEISIQSDTNFKVSCRRDNCYSESSRYVSASDRTNPCEGFASPAISGTNNTVKGENFTLTASGCADGSSYSWEPQGNVRFDNGVSSNEISIQSDTNFKVSCRRDNCYSESSRYVSASDRTNPCDGFASPAISGTNNTVKGENFTLTASGCADGSSYSWEPQGNVRFDNGVSSNEISIQSDTNFKVSCRRDNCYSESSRYVSASDRTNPCEGFASPAISGTNNTVKGENFTLTASGCADGSSYSWEPQGNVRFDNGVSSNEISIQSDADFKVTCSKNGCNSESGWHVKAGDSVRPIPKPNVNPTYTHMCAGSSVNISITGCPGNNFSWRDIYRNQSGSQNGTSYTADHPSYYALACLVDGRSGDGVTVDVLETQAPSAPSLSGPDEVLPGEAFTLKATGCAGTFNWSPGNYNAALRILPYGESAINASIHSDTQFSVSCTKDGCTGPPVSKVVRVISDTFPNWQQTTEVCNRTGRIWQDMNPNSKTRFQKQCRMPTVKCITYNVSVNTSERLTDPKDPNSDYNNNPDTCTNCIIYRNCSGELQVGDICCGTYNYPLEALEGSVTCRGCTAFPK